MKKHTPGPWYFDKKLGIIYVTERFDSHEDEIIIASDVSTRDGYLIATAPEMFEVLKLVAKHLDRYKDARLIKAVRDIVKKARNGACK